MGESALVGVTFTPQFAKKSIFNESFVNVHTVPEWLCACPRATADQNANETLSWSKFTITPPPPLRALAPSSYSPPPTCAASGWTNQIEAVYMRSDLQVSYNNASSLSPQLCISGRDVKLIGYFVLKSIRPFPLLSTRSLTLVTNFKKVRWY